MRLALALLLIAAVARADVALPPPPTLAITSERLANGLVVVVHEDPSVSSVALTLRYDLGPDDAAHAGYAHLVEKLATLGTVHTKPGEFDRRIDAAGGFTTTNADADGLRFSSQLPAGGLELALFLEAERMAGLADGITDAGLATARDAIDVEYRAAYVEEPYALVDREVDHALWGTTRDVLVDRATLSRATRDEVRRYVRTRLVPANATLAIVGRVDAQRALALARKYFAWIPPGARMARTSTPVAPLAPLAPLASPVARSAADPNGRRVVAYRTNARGAEDEVAVEIAARVIAGHLGSGVEIDVEHSRSGGTLKLTASTLSSDQIEQAIATTLTDNAVRAAASDAELDLLIALEGLAYRADALASGMEFERRLAVLRTLNADAVKRAATYWLAKSAAITVEGTSNAGATP